MTRISKQNIPSWAIALVAALGLHLVAIFLLNTYGGFSLWDAQTKANRHKLQVTFIEPKSVPSSKDNKQTVTTQSTVTETTAPPTLDSQDNSLANSSVDNPQTSEPALSTETESKMENNITPDLGVSGDVSTKSSLLDLSHFSLSPNAESKATQHIFSEEVQKKIAASKQAQKDYLKGPQKETSYPITEDADGTRYVNIKGVCWRIPKDTSKGSWAIVFDGCGLKEKSFHFELNISPSMLTNELLGPDSPFTLEQ